MTTIGQMPNSNEPKKTKGKINTSASIDELKKQFSSSREEMLKELEEDQSKMQESYAKKAEDTHNQYASQKDTVYNTHGGNIVPFGIQEDYSTKDTTTQSSKQTFSDDTITLEYRLEYSNGEFHFDMFIKKINPKNNDAEAFEKSNIFYNEKTGMYSFRGLSNFKESSLRSLITSEAKEIAGKTAIYRDFLNKQANGQELNPAEKKFMEHYLELIERHGLNINKNGDLKNAKSKN